MKTSVVIPTVNGPDLALRLLDLLDRQTIKPDEVIITEQGSYLWDHVSSGHSFHLKPVYLDQKSLALSREIGSKDAVGDIIFFLDDDIIIPETYISDAISFFENNPSIIAIGGRYLDDSIINRSSFSLFLGRILWVYGDGMRNKVLLSGWTDYVRNAPVEKETYADWLFGCNSVIRKHAFDQVSFEKEMKAWSFMEDVFIGTEIRNAFGNKSMMILPQLKVIHAPTSSAGSISPVTLRMRLLHRYMYWYKYLYPKNKGSIIPFIIGMIANFILIYKQERASWVINEHLKAWAFMFSAKNPNWEKINAYIFAQN